MRKIIHIDMDCFFAAVEMRDNPALRHMPLAVGGSQQNRGVISTANYLARQYGVHSAMPTARALKLCPNLTVLPGRFPVYKAVSAQILQILCRYTSHVEPVSLDEAYIEVTDSPWYRGSATLIAQHIRQAIFNELHLTASAGVAPVKFLAKIASDINKPNGQYVIEPQAVADFLKKLPLKKIPGVGKVTAERLESFGLYTCGDVQQADLAMLLRQFGKTGHTIWTCSQGIDARPVSADRQRKSVGIERTLAKDIYHWHDCKQIIEQLYPELVQRLTLVSPNLTIARQGVKLKFDDFQLTTQEHSWPQLNKTELLTIARHTWQERRAMRGVRLVGLHVTLHEAQWGRQLVLAF